MLTDTQKSQVRLMVADYNPINGVSKYDYGLQVAASDTFALSELNTYLPIAIKRRTDAINFANLELGLAQNRINLSNNTIAQAQGELIILNSNT